MGVYSTLKLILWIKKKKLININISIYRHLNREYLIYVFLYIGLLKLWKIVIIKDKNDFLIVKLYTNINISIINFKFFLYPFSAWLFINGNRRII